MNLLTQIQKKIIIQKINYKLGKYSLFRIPYKNDEFKLIRKIKIELNHRNWKDTKKVFKRLHYYYSGYINDIKHIISLSHLYAQKK